ncbi:hypothetical protein ACE939_06740 [Aquimarina sp. W85]|uniref:hypothetical protein n=1 Tax=Aquimarina rhodophyticola TaxID=3342246 RepID=UPI00366F317B
MRLVHRIGYYLGGFTIGLILLAFFLGGKRTSCDYSPNARVLKNIRIKDRAYSSEALNQMKSMQIDSADISNILTDGDVDFSTSITKLDSCNIYNIIGEVGKHQVLVNIKNCDSIATIQSISK